MFPMSGAMNSLAASLHNVTLSLPSRAGTVDILNGIDLEIEAGEAVGLVGPSGSGKTSLLMLMAGLERATDGKLQVAGLDLNGRTEAELANFRRDNIGIIFQSFHLIPTMTAIENVAVPLEFRGVAKAMDIAKDNLAAVGLGHRLTHFPGQLSGGEQQRVAIARALASGAKLLLADEPTGNLDQETGEQIIQLLFRMRKEQNASLLLITHDPNIAQRCDRIVTMRDGKLNS
jgi:putative ABC transport system ATP-binding protein